MMGPLVVTAALWGPHMLWIPGRPRPPTCAWTRQLPSPEAHSSDITAESPATMRTLRMPALPVPLHPAGLTVRTEAPGTEGLQRSPQKRQRRRQEGRRGREEEAGEQEQGAGGAAEATATEGPGTSDGASRRAWPDVLHPLQAPSQCLLSGSNRIVSTESARLTARKLPGSLHMS